MNGKTTLLNPSSNENKPIISLSEQIERVLIKGDLSVLSDEQRVVYYNKVCESVSGLNPLTRPFDYLSLNGKLVLYATKSCTDQLRSIHSISIEINSREKVGDVYIVSARARNAQGRVDESTGAVSIVRLSGDALANAYMKAETKAKRRVTLSICGLGLLDESEVETIPHAQVHPENFTTKQLGEPKAAAVAENRTSATQFPSQVDPRYRIDLGMMKNGNPHWFNGMTMAEAEKSQNPHSKWSIHKVYEWHQTHSYRTTGIHDFMAQYEAYKNTNRVEPITEEEPEIIRQENEDHEIKNPFA